MFLVLSALALTLTVEIFVGGQSNGNYTNGDEESAEFIPIIILAADLTRQVGLYLILFSTVEFTIAQSPCQVRGFVSFLLFEMAAIFTCLQGGLIRFIPDYRIAHAAIFVLISGFFILFRVPFQEVQVTQKR